MKKYNDLTVINNKLDKYLLRKKISNYNVFNCGGLDINEQIPEYINYSYMDTIAEIRKIQKKFMIYGYVYAIGDMADYDYGGDISELIDIIYNMSFDSSRVWVTNKKFSWCIEINSNYICFSFSPWFKIITKIKSYYILCDNKNS